MKSIILYPENDRYILKRIYKIFHSRNLITDASKINRNWTLDQLRAIYGILEDYSHIVLIMSPEYFYDIWFASFVGYIVGSKKECFIYLTEENSSLNTLFRSFTVGHGYSSVEIYADTESRRWHNIKMKEESRQLLIKSGFALSDDAMGESILSGQLDIVKNYINAGFSCSARNSKGVPMLSLAIRKNRLEIVKYLIENGADINAISDDRNNSPLMDAASAGDMESLKLLILEGADLECKSKDGQTALILAAGHGDVEISNYLISAGADYEVKDSLGMSAKSYATLFKKEDILVNMK